MDYFLVSFSSKLFLLKNNQCNQSVALLTVPESILAALRTYIAFHRVTKLSPVGVSHHNSTKPQFERELNFGMADDYKVVISSI